MWGLGARGTMARTFTLLANRAHPPLRFGRAMASRDNELRQSYDEQLTYLLFLKMTAERTKAPYKQKSPVPTKYSWWSLMKKDGDELFDHYRHTLEALGNQKGLLGLIFNKSQNKCDSPIPGPRPAAALRDPLSLALSLGGEGHRRRSLTLDFGHRERRLIWHSLTLALSLRERELSKGRTSGKRAVGAPTTTRALSPATRPAWTSSGLETSLSPTQTTSPSLRSSARRSWRTWRRRWSSFASLRWILVAQLLMPDNDLTTAVYRSGDGRHPINGTGPQSKDTTLKETCRARYE